MYADLDPSTVHPQLHLQLILPLERLFGRLRRSAKLLPIPVERPHELDALLAGLKENAQFLFWRGTIWSVASASRLRATLICHFRLALAFDGRNHRVFAEVAAAIPSNEDRVAWALWLLLGVPVRRGGGGHDG